MYLRVAGICRRHTRRSRHSSLPMRRSRLRFGQATNPAGPREARHGVGPPESSIGAGMRVGQIVIDIAPLRESRDFRWMFGGRLVSNAGNVVAVTAANWQVYQLTHSSLAVGLLTLADSAGMLIGPVSYTHLTLPT